MTFDLTRVRADFPILDEKIFGNRLVYLDSGASAQKPNAVLDKMDWVHRHGYANVHRGLHTLANRATEAYEDGRKAVQRLLNAARPEEIVFTKGATEAINLVASSFAAPMIREGDEIVLTIMEHHSNIIPWHFLRERKGVVLKFVPVTDEGGLDLDAYERLVGPKTKIVALSHMSNVTGAVSDVPRILSAARAVGAMVLLDGCQAVVHSKVDVQALDVDFYVFSGHKLFGPTGIGILYGKAERLADMAPYQGGGEMIGTVSMDKITYADPPHRFEAGTPPILEAIGLGAAIQWLETIDLPAARAHEMALYSRAVEGARQINGLKVLGETKDKGAILTFTLDGAHAHDVAQILDRYGIAVRAGTHCAEPLMRRFGVTSSARASFAFYNTLSEADALVDGLHRVSRFFS